MSGLPGLPIVLLYRGLHGFQLGEVLAHVRVQDHVDDQVAKIAKISLLHVGENVAVMLLDQPVKKKLWSTFFKKGQNFQFDICFTSEIVHN